MSKHTPGPWKGRKALGGSQSWIVEDEQEGFVAEVEFAPDARLIAAAPDLYEAVRHLMGCDFPDEVDFRCDGCNQAREALAKAEGKRS